MITDFFVIREEWNRYLLLPDKVPLRARMSPVSFNVEGGKVHVEFAQILKITPKESDKGSPSTDQSVRKEDILKTIAFDRIFESLNIYDIPTVRRLVMCKHSLTTFSMTNKFDSKGDRIYQCEWQLAIAPINYPPEVNSKSS